MSKVDTSDIEIRKATLDDVIGIVYVQATVWIASYSSFENDITKDDIRSLDFKKKVTDWQHIIRSPNYGVWVAARPNEILGVIAVRKEEDQAEVYELAVLAQYLAAGVGNQLFAEAKEWILNLPITARIISYSDKTADFYKQLGFSVSTLGEVDFINLPTGKSIATIEMRYGSQEAPSRPQQTHINTVMEPKKPTLKRPQAKKVGRSELAKHSNIRSSTIKYYTEIGILPFDQADTRLARRYDLKDALKRLEEIKHLREQGLSLKEITDSLQ